jgi:hypothetical protein
LGTCILTAQLQYIGASQKIATATGKPDLTRGTDQI